MQPEPVVTAQDNAQSNNTATETTNNVTAEQIPETLDQINWRQYRESRAAERKAAAEENRKIAAEKAKAEAEAQALKAALEAALKSPGSQYVQQQQVFEEDLTEDQRIDKKVNEALAIRERAMQEEQRRREAAEYPQRLVQTFSDFNNVCSTENLDYLEYHYPEIALAFKHTPEGYEKWSAVYKAVKRFVPNTDSKKDGAKADRNSIKPQAMNAPGANQTSDMSPKRNLDEASKAANYARMQKIIKGH